ncbi:MAG: hypothetical protein ACYCPQ_03700 [Elusimicrobiota bacterium]
MKKNKMRGLQIIFGGLFLMTLVWQRIESTALGYSVEISRQKIERLGGEIALLQKRLDFTLSCAQVAQAAQQKLGMSPAPLSAEKTLPNSGYDLKHRSFFSTLLTHSWRRAVTAVSS